MASKFEYKYTKMWTGNFTFSQIEEIVVKEFDNIVLADNIPIDYSVLAEPVSLLSYIETWRVRVFDHAFLHYYKGADPFTKAKVFSEYRGTDLVVKRVIFRYVNLLQCIQWYYIIFTFMAMVQCDGYHLFIDIKFSLFCLKIHYV
jgi:hypothetical protein